MRSASVPRLLVAPSALADLDDIATYIGQDNPPAADDFLDRAEASFHTLAEHPGLGRERRDLVELPLLFWPLGNYWVVYRPCPGGVEIVRVISALRHLPEILS